MENDSLRSILRKKKRNIVKKIPEKIYNDNIKEIPGVIRVKYKNSVNVDQIDQTIKFKLEKIGDREMYQKYIENSKNYIINFNDSGEVSDLENYLDFCTKFIRIERIKTIDNRFLCKGCKENLDDEESSIEGIIICKNCNCINTYLTPNHYTRDIEKTNVFDEDINNFIKILDKFEGKTSLILDGIFFQKLDNYFKKLGIEEGSVIRKHPLTKEGKKVGTTKKLLWNALEELGYSQYYEEVSYITHVYWGWRLPDLTRYKDKIIRDYQNSQNIWSTIKHEYKRTASLGTQFRLYVQLLAVGYPNCCRDDFKIQENVESLRLHNDAWKRICEICNITYHYVSN